MLSCFVYFGISLSTSSSVITLFPDHQKQLLVFSKYVKISTSDLQRPLFSCLFCHQLLHLNSVRQILNSNIPEGGKVHLLFFFLLHNAWKGVSCFTLKLSFLSWWCAHRTCLNEVEFQPEWELFWKLFVMSRFVLRLWYSSQGPSKTEKCELDTAFLKWRGDWLCNFCLCFCRIRIPLLVLPAFLFLFLALVWMLSLPMFPWQITMSTQPISIVSSKQL